MMKVKTISSLEKCFLDEKIDSKKEYKKGSCLKNETYRFSVCYTIEDANSKNDMKLNIISPIKEYIKVYSIEHAPVHMPAYANNKDDNYLRTTPGLYPDILIPMSGDKPMIYPSYNLQSIMIEIATNGEIEAGEYPVEIQFLNIDDTVEADCEFNIEIIDAFLPEQTLINTQWFYCDCLQKYYGTESFDERHWEIIENYVKTAVKNGMNMILTPVFTPPLDTLVGGERPTTQLVDVIVKNGEYSFNFDKLGRWIDMCDRVGIKYYEISHFFTQWGAEHAPKIIAYIDGEKRQIFGWETDAVGTEYKRFLSVFIPELLAFMKSKNSADKRAWFHISDEPQKEQIEQYTAARSIVEELLKGYPIMDALSNYEFYEQGAVTHPIPSTNHIESFIENKVPELWTYYCCGNAVNVSNRFLSMPSARNRVIGTQMYKYDIVGFLHWGYNFYFNQYSRAEINPYIRTDGEYFSPAGDTFSVYPAPDGTAYESLRLSVFFDALQDMRAMQLCERLYSKDFVVEIIDENIEPITFKSYPHDAEWLLDLREKINLAIKKAL